VSVFLRWGVFGILGVAALMYAYNASRRLAEAHAARPRPVAAAVPTARAESPPVTRDERPTAPASGPLRPTPPHCEAELTVARRAIEMRKQGEPLDRVLRTQEVAWQEPAERRQRLEKVATRWYGYEGDFAPEALRIAVISDCVQHSPPP
jgi:hypothetical protein